MCLGSVGGRMWSGSVKWSESVYRRSADVYGNGVVWELLCICGVVWELLCTCGVLWLEITTFVCSRVPAALNAPLPPPPPPLPSQCHLHSEVMPAPLMYSVCVGHPVMYSVCVGHPVMHCVCVCVGHPVMYCVCDVPWCGSSSCTSATGCHTNIGGGQVSQ